MLTTRYQKVDTLNVQDIARMHALFEENYAYSPLSTFLSDLEKKEGVFIVRKKATQEIVGFSTLGVYTFKLGGKKAKGLFSGDTILDRNYWGSRSLQKAFALKLFWEALKSPLTPQYWLLISKGYKTYLLVSRGCPDHWPRHDQETPAQVLGMIDQLATEKFGDDWKPEKGILQFAKPAGRLKEGVAPIDAKALQHADIRFFAERNPGHEKGDELCCLAAINLKLGVFYVNKLLNKAIRRQLNKLKG